MFEILIFAAGVIVGVVYDKFLQPYVTRAWDWLKSKMAPDSTGG